MEKNIQTKSFSKQGKRLPQYITAGSVCLGSLAAGTVLGWTGNITEELKSGKFNNIEINDSDLKWIGSCATLGAMIMCFPTGIMCDKLGRKLALLLLTIPFVAGWLLIAFANSVLMIYIGRFITGMATGAFLVSGPLYTSEIAEKAVRGALVILSALVSLGIMIAYITGYLADPKLHTIIVAILPLVFAITFLFQPETPVYDMKQGKEDQARANLIRLRGSSYDINAELGEIKAAIEEDKKNPTSLMNSIKKRSTRKAAIISFGLMLFQQAGGINAVIFYTSNIFESSGAEINAKIATIVIGAVQVISTFISFLIVDKFGRRILLLGSALLMAMGLLILGIFFSLSERSLLPPSSLTNLGFMPLLGLTLFIITYCLGFGPLPWVMAAELFPPEIKSVAVAAAGMFNWFIAFLITNFYFDLKEAIGGDVAFYMFSVICLIGTVFVFFVVPETKGKPDLDTFICDGINNIRNGPPNENPGATTKTKLSFNVLCFACNSPQQIHTNFCGKISETSFYSNDQKSAKTTNSVVKHKCDSQTLILNASRCPKKLSTLLVFDDLRVSNVVLGRNQARFETALGFAVRLFFRERVQSEGLDSVENVYCPLVVLFSAITLSRASRIVTAAVMIFICVGKGGEGGNGG
ncbi:hypothetical protein ILUMI_00921 [Ignelater luminosus]|uniref:Major facilitator superfamily (MFS) profile domain-containing protein n=1 Tax=Ignelater luminosus TaxID=2038154 RepID=A0A8K0DFB8_IGNLU|nr:hypothetical protein ILUMI_00921 [Ignelater luminosus]